MVYFICGSNNTRTTIQENHSSCDAARSVHVFIPHTKKKAVAVSLAIALSAVGGLYVFTEEDNTSYRSKKKADKALHTFDK